MPITSRSPDPTQQEIFDACTSIRNGWTTAERRRREDCYTSAEHVSDSRRPETSPTDARAAAAARLGA